MNDETRSLRVFYTKRRIVSHKHFPTDTMVFSADQYGSYSRNTTFSATVFTRGLRHEIGQVRIVIIGGIGQRLYLNTLTEEPLVEFPLKGVRYLSVGTSIEYYERLAKLFPLDRLIPGLLAAHDVVAIQHLDRINDDYRTLVRTKHFRRSLLRGMSATQAYSDGASVLFPSSPPREETRLPNETRVVHKPGQKPFILSFTVPHFSAPHCIEFDFTPGPLPTNINILIGANGTGKTQALRHLSDYLLERGVGAPEKVARLSQPPLSSYPAFRQIIVASFSPFDTFASSKRDVERRDVEYLYCGFRDANGRFRVSYAIDQTARHLESIARDVHTETAESRMTSLINVLHEAFHFDDIVLEYSIDGQRRSKSLLSNVEPIDIDAMKRPGFRVRFNRNSEEFSLSAGQTLFVLLATAIVSVIRDQSLLLIDEPELYLHPNLELSFVRLLKRLLATFRSYAVIATHSAIITREVPSRCVRVLRTDVSGAPSAFAPSFETFGADVSRIVNYVFDNPLIGLPHQQWLLEAYGTRDFFELVETEAGLNLESLSFLRNHDRHAGGDGS